MMAFFDVQYGPQQACAAAVWAQNWEDAVPAGTCLRLLPAPSDYEPGHFYRRELPCLLALWEALPQTPDVAVVDGYVYTAPNTPGLGWHFYEAIGRACPVIGVAKSLFVKAEPVAMPLFRGQSRQALWVSAVGWKLEEAHAAIARMHGPYRLPALLKWVDRLARDGGPTHGEAAP
jgi:deoxyribonuclease V